MRSSPPGTSTLDRDLYRFSWAAKHRLRAVETTYPRRRRLLGKERFRRWVASRLEERVVSQQTRARERLVPAVPPAPPRDRVDEVVSSLPEPVER